MSTILNLVELREGGTQDLSAVGSIMRDAFEDRFGEGWTSAQCLGMMSLPGVWLILASMDGQDCGFALARSTGEEAELLLLAARPAVRRRGVGGALLRAIVAEAEARGGKEIHLEVRAGNDAVMLYRREGFDKVGERRDYYRGRSGQLFDAQTFARKIGASHRQ